MSSAGLGTLNHLAAELFKMKHRTRTSCTFPYRGGVPALQAVMNGEVQLFMGSLGGHRPACQERSRQGAGRDVRPPLFGRARAFRRCIEAGVPDFDVSTWIGALAPARIGAERQQQRCTAR